MNFTLWSGNRRGVYALLDPPLYWGVVDNSSNMRLYIVFTFYGVFHIKLLFFISRIVDFMHLRVGTFPEVTEYINSFITIPYRQHCMSAVIMGYTSRYLQRPGRSVNTGKFTSTVTRRLSKLTTSTLNIPFLDFNWIAKLLIYYIYNSNISSQYMLKQPRPAR